MMRLSKTYVAASTTVNFSKYLYFIARNISGVAFGLLLVGWFLVLNQGLTYAGQALYHKATPSAKELFFYRGLIRCIY
jgi:hypothetical protein